MSPEKLKPLKKTSKSQLILQSIPTLISQIVSCIGNNNNNQQQLKQPTLLTSCFKIILFYFGNFCPHHSLALIMIFDTKKTPSQIKKYY